MLFPQLAFAFLTLCVVSVSAEATKCTVYAGKTIGTTDLDTINDVADAGTCCDLCTHNERCAAWTHHAPPTSTCWLKANTVDTGRPTDPHNRTCSGLRVGPLPQKPSPYACQKGFDHFPFCDISLPVEQRVADLVARINDTDKPNLLTARGLGGHGDKMQAIPELGVPGAYPLPLTWSLAQPFCSVTPFIHTMIHVLDLCTMTLTLVSHAKFAALYAMLGSVLLGNELLAQHEWR